MNIHVIRKLPSAEEIIQEFPLSPEGHAQVDRHKEEVKNIIAGRDSRFLCIVGPCSAWPYDAALEYADRLKALSNKVSDKVKLVMRVFIQKPRTRKGWTGPVNQPDPYGAPDIIAGIQYCRSLMVKIAEKGIPLADEALFTHNARGFIELLSWVAIGARSVEDQEHRIFASAVDCAVGMKNSTSGSIDAAVNGIVAAQSPHTTVLNGSQVETAGNLYAHLVLRGSTTGPNYDAQTLLTAYDLLLKNEVANPAILIDASHDNTIVDGKKDYRRQPLAVESVLRSREEHPELKKAVKGFMMESFLKEGNQKCDDLTPETIDRGGLSITDACLSFEDTAKVILDIAKHA